LKLRYLPAIIAVLQKIHPAASSLVRNHLPFVMLTVILGGLHTWAAITRHSMNPDGVSYLDIGDAYFRGDWVNAINAVWPPLYSWLLGLVNFIFKPTMQWEFPTVHIVNFAIYLGALASFIYLWQGLRRPQQIDEERSWFSIPEWHWWALGYTLFIWTSLSLIQVWAVTPDMLTAALVFLAAGLVARIRTSKQNWRLYAYLGLVLGLGYLAKTFMFSIAFIFLALCLLVTPFSRKSILKTVLTLSIFLIVSLPFIFLISQKVGKVTIGEAGSITYLRYVGGVPFPHWQGDPASGIVPTHPSRILLADPTIYEFGDPIGGTYPISNDPSYWYVGIEVPFNFGNQLSSLYSGGLFYLDLFGQRHAIFFASILALFVIAFQQKAYSNAPIRQWALILPAIAAFGLYSLVLVADRYIGLFLMLFWADILANIRLPDTLQNRAVMRVLSSIAIIGLLLNIIVFNLEGMGRLNPPNLAVQTEQAAGPPEWPGAVAIELQQLGIEPMDRVAVIGYAYDSFWARLARVTIVAEMLEEDAVKFWTGDDKLQESVLTAFAQSGAKAVVAEFVPDYARLEGWRRVDQSNYFIYVFGER
jgi:hypothetical protein